MTYFFAVVANDRPGMQEVRARVRRAHREYLRAPGVHRVTVRLGGPLLADDGRTMNGTLLVVEADSAAEVERFVADDPYTRNGVFDRIEIRHWAWGLGNPDARF
jgi:uncharacterized protein YciI